MLILLHSGHPFFVLPPIHPKRTKTIKLNRFADLFHIVFVVFILYDNIRFLTCVFWYCLRRFLARSFTLLHLDFHPIPSHFFRHPIKISIWAASWCVELVCVGFYIFFLVIFFSPLAQTEKVQARQQDR